MTEPRYIIRTMTAEEVSLAVEWAAQEGWNPGLHDVENYLAADPNGFLVGLRDGEPVASISAVKYSDEFGFIGFYIVKPEQRGQGYGIQIWNAALDYLDGCNVALDGVVDQQANYRKSGFQFAYNNIRYQCRGLPKEDRHSAPALQSLAEIPDERICESERAVFPVERSGFLKRWITQPEAVALGWLEKGQLCGWGVIRPCRSGSKIGPLIADTPEIADSLLQALLATIGENNVAYLDVPHVNPAAMDLAQQYGMSKVFETARMYTREIPSLSLDQLYGVTSFEVG